MKSFAVVPEQAARLEPCLHLSPGLLAADGVYSASFSQDGHGDGLGISPSRESTGAWGKCSPLASCFHRGPARYPAGAEFTKQLPLVPDPVSKPRIITVRVFALQDPWVHLAPS